MTTLRTSLDERREEFETHYALATAVETRIFTGDEISLGQIQLSARHLSTIKSGLIIHLYNIVESIMTLASRTVGAAVGSVPPRDWSANALREWLREYGVSRVDGGEDARLQSVHNMSQQLMGDAPLGAQKLKKPSGTWTDKHIATFAARLGVAFNLPTEMWVRIAEKPEYGDNTPLEFLADRRNAIAHGRRSFEDGAKDLTLAQIRDLADVTLDYVSLAADAFQVYVNEHHFRVSA